VAAAGAGALTSDEEIRVYTGVLANLQSNTNALDEFVIHQTPDSFLLGEVSNDAWATIKADLMTQFACPEGFKYPENSEIDSIALMMTYTSWFAEGNPPLVLSVYELDKGTFGYNDVLSSREDVDKYWSGEDSTHVVVEDQIVVAAKPSDSLYSQSESKYYPIIRFKMTEPFVRKMNRLKLFPKQKEFNEFFKGLYLTSVQGNRTALYVNNITMIMYYHYPYTTKSTTGGDSTVIGTSAKYLYANSEVRQVNLYSFPNKNQVVEEMQLLKDTINFVVSPAYVYTVIDVPLAQYVDTILAKMHRDKQGDTLQTYINKAVLQVSVMNSEKTSTDADKWADPASDMLLIRQDSLQAFFDNHYLPSDDYCVLASLTQSINSDYTYSYRYDFDVSTLLYNAVHRKMNNETITDHAQMVLVPVHVDYTTSSSSVVVSQVKVNQTITYTEIRSAQLKTDPLDIDVVFSGFTINRVK